MKDTFYAYSLKFVVAIVLSLVMISACSDDDDNPNTGDDKLNFKFAVFSDPHLLAKSLMTPGDPGEAYIEQGRKLLQESDAILESLTNSIVASDVDFVLVPGDLTKDGEKASLQSIAGYLEQIENSGKEVYVIPGNHDISNYWAVDYSSGTAVSTDMISATDFETIMGDFGYIQALAKDASSLSYVIEPVEGLVIICLDASKYEENQAGEESIVGGRLKAQTLAWAKNQIELAVTDGKMVFGMMHHGLVEHFQGQKSFPISSEYVIDDWETVADELSAAGMKIMFTGHFHANDVVLHQPDDNWIYDIETGSAISPPSPWRILEVSNSEILDIKTNYVTSINYDLDGEDYQTYASEEFSKGMYLLIMYVLMNEYGVDEASANQIAPVIAASWLAHYNGDEIITAQAQGVVDMLSNGDATMQLVGSMIQSIYTDLPPVDNDLKINLTSGAVVN